MVEMRKHVAEFTEREQIEQNHISLLQDLGLEDIQVRRYSISDKKIQTTAKYTCRYNSWEVVVKHKALYDRPAGTLAIVSIESLIDGSTYELDIQLRETTDVLNTLKEIRDIFDNDPTIYIEELRAKIECIETALRFHSIQVESSIIPDVYYAQGCIKGLCGDKEVFISLGHDEDGNRSFLVSNTPFWKNKNQNTKVYKGISIPVANFEMQDVLDFIEKELFKQKLPCRKYYQDMANEYSWHK